MSTNEKILKDIGDAINRVALIPAQTNDHKLENARYVLAQLLKYKPTLQMLDGAGAQAIALILEHFKDRAASKQNVGRPNAEQVFGAQYHGAIRSLVGNEVIDFADNAAFGDVQDICHYLIEILNFMIANKAAELVMKTKVNSPQLNNILEQMNRCLSLCARIEHGEYAGYKVSLNFNIESPDLDDSKEAATIQ